MLNCSNKNVQNWVAGWVAGCVLKLMSDEQVPKMNSKVMAKLE